MLFSPAAHQCNNKTDEGPCNVGETCLTKPKPKPKAPSRCRSYVECNYQSAPAKKKEIEREGRVGKTPCVFPWKFEDGPTEYNGCADPNNSGYLWCPTELDDDGKYFSGKWGVCEASCPNNTAALSTPEGNASQLLRLWFCWSASHHYVSILFTCRRMHGHP